VLPNNPVFSPRFARKAAVGASMLVVAAGCALFLNGDGSGNANASRASSSGAGPGPVPTVASSKAAVLANAGALGSPPVDPTAARPTTTDSPEQTAENLRAFFDKLLKQENLSRDDIAEFQARLLASIENNPLAVKAVEQFYRNMPAEQGMERDILRSMLVGSSVGRGIVLQEANAIWENKAEPQFAEMYETYFNLPGQAPQEVLARALADMKKGAPTDERTTVARLNFIGTLEDPSIPDAANLRSEAIQLLNQLAQGQGSELVRALAVQKLYRLNSPAEASNIAVGQLAKGAYPDLVRETLNSISSGDVELTPNLRTALTTAVKRPAASAAERQQFSQVVGAGS
jgi:hypothetical protein